MDQIILGILCFISMIITWGNCVTNTEYFMLPERAEYTYQNPEYTKDLTINIRRVNRTSFALSAGINYIKDIEDAESHIAFKQFLNNQYKDTGIVVDALLCDLMGDGDLNVYKEFMTDGIHGNLTDCDSTFPKGIYFVKDAIVSSKIKKTIFLPGKWKVEFKITNKDDVLIFTGEFFFKIQETLTD